MLTINTYTPLGGISINYMEDTMRVRCNQCMSEFDEEYIELSKDKDYFFEEEICPICKKGGCLMDMPTMKGLIKRK